MPPTPLIFWRDVDRLRCRNSYFDLFPGVWRHGDWLNITPAGSAIIHRRSDTTLNRHGRRMGTSETDGAVEADDDIVDSLIVDLELLGYTSFMSLFVVPKDDVRLDNKLAACLRDWIRSTVSPRFVHNEIHAAPEMPHSLTGTKQKLRVDKLLLDRTLGEFGNRDVCTSPSGFSWFE